MPAPERPLFSRFSRFASDAVGRPPAFLLAVLVVLLWAATGPVFAFDSTWQLVINTGTTIVTFLMVFLIQNSQNRDTAAMQLKLDELIHMMAGADDRLLDLEELGDHELKAKRETYEDMAKLARQQAPAGGGAAG